jgi:U3 small nucleolar RNA-associated protein 5
VAADSDRYMNVFSIPQKRLTRTLVASNGVRKLTFLDQIDDQMRSFSNQQLAAVTQNGVVEIFSRPFVDMAESGADGSIKVKRKSMTRKANASIKLVRVGSTSSVVPVCDASFQGPDLILAWTEGGVNLSFEKIKWRDENRAELLFSGVKEVVATKRISTFASGMIHNSKDVKKSHVDESHAVVVKGNAVSGKYEEAGISLSKDEADPPDVMDEQSHSESEEAPDKVDEEGNDPSTRNAASANGADESLSADSDVETDEVAQPSVPANMDEDDEAEPSFGDLLATRSSNPISIADALPTAELGVLVPVETSQPVAIPTGISLSTVLTQALRTNDNNLLESCFHNTDVEIIRSTVQRIDSSLAGILIQKLAERLSSRPGRYGHLLVWVQWICVAHGGAIAGQPDVLNKIKTLYKVLSQRSKALDSLLLLKGKLDMLDAQLGLRKQLLTERGPITNSDEGHVIYVEGEEESDSSDEGSIVGAASRKTSTARKSKKKKHLHELISDNEDDSEDDEDMPMTNGVVAQSDDSDLNSKEDDEGPLQQREGGLIDDEAEESDADSHPSDREDEMSEEEDGIDEGEEDSEMDDFIDDGPIEEDVSDSEISLDQTPEKPSKKRHRLQ